MTQQDASADAKRYTLRGKVVAVDKARKKASIAHEEVENYMPAMTMDFPIKDDWVFDELSRDADIRGDLVVDADGFWLENVAIVAAPNPNQTPLPIKENVVQIGKEVPALTLINQDGKRISLKDFRGKASAITFIYSRCPLPEYCTKMSTNFSDLARQLQTSDLKNDIRLLTVSFDPKIDTPKVLKDYGLAYLRGIENPDFTVWQLATGTDKEVKDIAGFFGLRYETDENDKTQFNHSLRTIVITPEGKVQKVFSGNEWTTGDLLKELQATIK
ncbi:MAG TPA: SCO family protein [Pyrinomonadaceae bacterium]|nr:SCO family protein [Pyrinomonadaceae bacterium]